MREVRCDSEGCPCGPLRETVPGCLQSMTYLVACASHKPRWILYLLYLDESGNPYSWQDQNHFVMAGIAVHEGQVDRLTSQMDQIEAEFFPQRGIPAELHATDIQGGKGLFRTIPERSRQNLMEAICTLISESRFPHLVTFATAIHVSSAVSANQAIHDVFQDVCVRFNTLLVRQYHDRHPTKGLLVIDRGHAEHYQQLVEDFRREGTQFGYINNLVDIPFFASSKDTRMLQLADFCAFAVFRYYERNDRRHFDRLLPRFDRRDPNHPPDGLKHITRIECSCVSCAWRRGTASSE